MPEVSDRDPDVFGACMLDYLLVENRVTCEIIGDGLVDARALVTHTFGFEDARQILNAALEGSEPIIKAVMMPNG
jgi:threonine dehydrogenase-like Zn-dependent dehydrogenase